MDPVEQLTRGLVQFGPALLGLLTFIETSTLLGLFVPAGVTFLVAVFLTTQGTLALPTVVAWALVGAFAGDSVGYWFGRIRGGPDAGERGLVARLATRAGPRVLSMLNQTPLTSVSLARVISFARTLAPMVAGAGRMPYARYLVYDAVGIAAWAATYVAVGVMAGESWRVVSQWVGGAWALVFVLAVAALVLARRRRGPLGEPVGPHPLSVGLTGNAASGKSTVARMWAEAGVPVIDADQLAREAVAAGTAGLQAVVHAFGSEILAPDGSLDRGKLGKRVFANPRERRRLETLLHPRIAELRSDWIQARAQEGHPLVVSEIPLLYEVGMEGEFDQVVHVHVPREVSKSRLIRDRGLAPASADGVLEAQVDSETKVARADYVIENTGSRAELKARALDVLNQLQTP